MNIITTKKQKQYNGKNNIMYNMIIETIFLLVNNFVFQTYYDIFRGVLLLMFTALHAYLKQFQLLSSSSVIYSEYTIRRTPAL